MFEQNKLEVTDSYIYLGTNLNYNGLFNKAITKQVNQSRRAMFNLTTKARKLALPIDIQCELTLKIKSIIDGCGLTNTWHDHNIVNIKWLKQNLELKMKDINIQTWHSEIHANYAMFKLQNIKK